MFRFRFWSVIRSELNFLDGMRYASKFYVLYMDIHHLSKRLCLLSSNCFVPLQVLTFVFSILFHCSTCLSLTQYCTVFIIVVLY